MKVLSGMQPTGRFHWGNYFGAIRQYIDLQDNEQAFYFIADYHALTTVRESEVLKGYVRDAALDLLALQSFPKTSGSRGIHVLVPIARRHTYEDTRSFASIVAGAPARAHPGLVATESAKYANAGADRSTNPT